MPQPAVSKVDSDVRVLSQLDVIGIEMEQHSHAKFKTTNKMMIHRDSRNFSFLYEFEWFNNLVNTLKFQLSNTFHLQLNSALAACL